MRGKGYGGLEVLRDMTHQHGTEMPGADPTDSATLISHADMGAQGCLTFFFSSDSSFRRERENRAATSQVEVSLVAVLTRRQQATLSGPRRLVWNPLL